MWRAKPVVPACGFGSTHQWLVDDLPAASGPGIILAEDALPTVPPSMLLVPGRAGIARLRRLGVFLVEEVAKIARIGARAA